MLSLFHEVVFLPLLSSPSPPPLLLAAFFIGMVCASLQAHGYIVNMTDRTLSTIAAAALWFVFFEPIPTHKAIQTVLSGMVFFSIVNGCSLFGLLTNRGAQRLGEVSYGIYLLQGIVLFSFAQFPEIRVVAVSSSMHYWLFLMIESLTMYCHGIMIRYRLDRKSVV